MPKDPKLAQSQIEVALFQSRKLVPPEAVDAMPVIGDWCGLSENGCVL